MGMSEGSASLGKKCQEFIRVGFSNISAKRFDCVRMRLCILVCLCMWKYDFILCVPMCVCVCMCDLSDTHPLYERHITLQMTLLDGDGPFKCSTLMQSAVNTLNQAAEEEAAYPSSLPLPPSLFPDSYILFLPLPPPLFHLLKSVSLYLSHFHFLLSTFWFSFLPFCYLYLKVPHGDTPESLSYTDSTLPNWFSRVLALPLTFPLYHHPHPSSPHCSRP